MRKRLRKVLDDWRLANATPIYKKGWKEGLESYQVPGRVVDHLGYDHTAQHIQDNKWIRHSQLGLRKDRSCFINLISFYYKVPCLGDVVHLDFSKTFNTDSHSILLERLIAHGLDR